MRVALIKDNGVAEVREISAWRDDLAGGGWKPIVEVNQDGGDRERFVVLDDVVECHRCWIEINDKLQVASDGTIDIGPITRKLIEIEGRLAKLEAIEPQSIVSVDTSKLDRIDGLADAVLQIAQRMQASDEALGEAAAGVVRSDLGLIELKRRLDVIEAAMRLLADEAARKMAEAA